MASVNRPVNEKQKEADINNKLQLYGIFSGEWPSDRSAGQCFVVAELRPIGCPCSRPTD